MDIGAVDRSATRGRSPLHRVAPVTKLLAFMLVLAAVVLTTNVLVLLGLALTLTGIGWALRLPRRTLLSLAAYPGLFAAIFAFAASAGWLGGALVVLKAITAALAAVMLLLTTPYPQVFAPLQRILPGILGDVLLMTYRSLFLLIDTFSHTLQAARLRAGLAGVHPIRSARAVTRSLGGVLLYSIDLSQRTYDIMRLRGYEGRLRVSPIPATSGLLDGITLSSALLLLAGASAWRLEWQRLNPYSWLPALLGALVLAVGVLLSLRKEP